MHLKAYFTYLSKATDAEKYVMNKANVYRGVRHLQSHLNIIQHH